MYGGGGAAWDYGIGSAIKSSDSSFIQAAYRTLCANRGLGDWGSWKWFKRKAPSNCEQDIAPRKL